MVSKSTSSMKAKFWGATCLKHCRSSTFDFNCDNAERVEVNKCVVKKGCDALSCKAWSKLHCKKKCRRDSCDNSDHCSKT